MSVDQIVARAWREVLEEELGSSGILFGVTVTAGHVAYPLNFECLEDGEISAVVSGNFNPKFLSPEQLPEFKEAVVRVVAPWKNINVQR